MPAAELKKHFKEVREAYMQEENGRNWAIRVHRALSWLQRAEALEDNAELAEARLLYYWISFNSLYSCWDPERNVPSIDSQRMHRFIPELFQIGAGGEMGKLVDQMRPAVKRLLRNKFLSSVFWRNPEGPEATQLAMEDALALDAHYRDRRHDLILRQVLDRVYVLRGQIVHGASTSGGKLNRESLKDCTGIMQRLMPVVLSLVIDRGPALQWPELCYPPLK